MQSYYANEMTVGRVRSGEYPFEIGVLPASHASVPIGIAVEIGITVDGQAVWRLKVGGERVPGRFVIEEGQFIPVEPAQEDENRAGVVRRTQPAEYRELVFALICNTQGLLFKQITIIV
jgi:hypothetical protein